MVYTLNIMADLTITFNNDIPLDLEAKNPSDFTSYTADDIAYDMIYSASVSNGVISSLKQVGICKAINRTTNVITVTEVPFADVSIDMKDITVNGVGTCSATDLTAASIAYPTAGDFIFFAKSKTVQNNGLLGYYMQVKMKITPGSSKNTELFSLGTEIFESSK